MSATDADARLAGALMTIGGVGILAGLWSGLAPFVGPTFNYSPDGGASWHWDLARAMLGALPGAAAVIAGLLVMACARTSGLSIGRGGIAFGAMVMFASGAWLAVGPFAWPQLWNHAYFMHSSALSDFGRVAGFAAGPAVFLAAIAGLAAGAMMVRDRGRLVADDVEDVRPIAVAGSHNDALTSDVGGGVSDTDLA